jgi:CubicO group peptidase (beta-lactamase class C family)
MQHSLDRRRFALGAVASTFAAATVAQTPTPPTSSTESHAAAAIYQRNYPTNDDILAVSINDPLVAQPGTEVSDSAFGFTLASLVMVTAAGRSFLELLISEVGSWFGLRSLAIDNPFVITPFRVSGYTNDEETTRVSRETAEYWYGEIEGQWAKIPQVNPASSIAGGGLLMTPSDTAQFGTAMVPASGATLGEEEREPLFMPIPEAPMGLAWNIDADEKGRARWHHGGATAGGRASLVVYPELDLSISLASNVATIPDDVLQPSSDLAGAFSQPGSEGTAVSRQVSQQPPEDVRSRMAAASARLARRCLIQAPHRRKSQSCLSNGMACA